MRVVADTNIYISALNFGGAAEELLALGRHGIIDIYISAPILEEIGGVLARKFQWSRAREKAAVSAIKNFAVVVEPRERISVLRDDPDNRILECGVAAGADVIVSGDMDIRRVGEFRGIAIESPRTFLDKKAWEKTT